MDSRTSEFYGRVERELYTSVLADVLTSMQSIPLSDGALFSGASLMILDGLRYSVLGVQSSGIGSTLSQAEVAGATTLHLTSTTNFPATGWALVNGQYVYWSGKTNGTPGTLTGVPSSGRSQASVRLPAV